MPAATLTAPFNDLSLNGHVPEESINLANNHVPDQNANHQLEAVGLSSGQTPQNTKKRAHKIAPKAGLMSIQTQTMPSPDPYTTPISSRRSRRKPRALRQTPLPEDATMANIHLPRSHPGSEPANRDAEPAEPADSNHHSLTPGSSQHKRRHCREEADQDGWATEDATDIQDMGDFDFKKNLSKFDKRKVFDQIKQEDTTADEARLVNLNRVPAPRHGTAEGKNLHFTENVLDSAANNGIPEKMLAVHVEHSSGDSDLEACEARISSGRSSHRTFSRTSKRSTRKGSALAMGNQYGGFTTVTDPVERLSRHGTHDRIESPIIITDSSTSGYRKSSSTGKSSFEIVSSNGICPCVSPLQMLELEQLATAELGLTEEMITENAARSIAETAFGLAASEDGHPASYKPLIVILAGNTKTGSRAIAAGRHLRNHGARVVLCVLGLERESDLLQSVQRQLRIFRNCGRQAIKQDMLVRTLRKLQTPAELVVDALLGMHLSFDDLRTEDQATYLELVCWANGSDAGTLALDVPSGVDPSTGIASAHDENELVIKPDFVLSLGAPKIGLLAAMTGMKERTWSCFVADIGISGVAWKKFGTRRRGGVEFGGLWVAEIVFKDGA